MKRKTALRVVERCIAALVLVIPVASDAAERLSALSTTAMSITGDVPLSPALIVFGNKIALKLALVGQSRSVQRRHR